MRSPLSTLPCRDALPFSPELLACTNLIVTLWSSTAISYHPHYLKLSCISTLLSHKSHITKMLLTSSHPNLHHPIAQIPLPAAQQDYSHGNTQPALCLESFPDPKQNGRLSHRLVNRIEHMVCIQ